MTEKDKRIFDRLKSDFDYVTSLGYKVLGVFLQGSQNYGLDYEGSDIDTKAIVIPSFEDFVLNKKPASTTLILPSNEHIDVKDIRLMHECFRKQNINFIEILFTKYRYMNPDYEALYQPMFNNNEKIAHYNNYAAVNCIAGMVYEKHKAMEHPYPTLKDKIEKYGYDCYTDDTKFLTRNGWKSYYEIEDNEEIGTLNPQTKELEFQNFYQRFCNQYNGEIYDVETYNSHFTVTPNHKIYTSSIKNINVNGHKYIENLSNWQLESIQDVMNTKHFRHNSSKHRHLAVVYNNNNDLREYEGVKITDDLLKLIGAFASEGTVSFRDNNVKSINIAQADIKAEHNLNFIKMMDSIKDIKINKYTYPSRRNKQYNEIIWIITDSVLREKIYQWCKHKSENKQLPNFIFELSKRQARILLDSLCLGDGTEQTSRRVYYTISKKLAEDVQILSMMAGYYAVMMGGQSGFKCYGGFNDEEYFIYQVAIKKEEYVPNWCYFKLGKNVKLTNYNGNIVCFSVPNSILITQKDGKIAIQGNCKQLHHIIRCEEFLNRYIAGVPYSECLIPTNPQYLINVKAEYIHSLEEARQIASNCEYLVKLTKQNYMDTHPVVIDYEVDEIMNDVLFDVLKHSFREEINE